MASVRGLPRLLLGTSPTVQSPTPQKSDGSSASSIVDTLTTVQPPVLLTHGLSSCSLGVIIPLIRIVWPTVSRVIVCSLGVLITLLTIIGERWSSWYPYSVFTVGLWRPHFAIGFLWNNRALGRPGIPTPSSRWVCGGHLLRLENFR